MLCRRAEDGQACLVEGRMPLYCSESNVEQERVSDLDEAKNLGDLEVRFPEEAYTREFLGVEVGLVRGVLTEGKVLTQVRKA